MLGNRICLIIVLIVGSTSTAIASDQIQSSINPAKKIILKLMKHFGKAGNINAEKLLLISGKLHPTSNKLFNSIQIMRAHIQQSLLFTGTVHGGPG
jgi:hypothetical protein